MSYQNNTSTGVYNAKGVVEDENVKIPSSCSWPVIILAFVLFFPVGIYLLIKRSSIEQKSPSTAGKALRIWGYIFIGFAVYCIFSIAWNGIDGSGVGVILFFIILGVILVGVGKREQKNAVQYNKYKSIILGQYMTSLDEIAANSSVSFETAKKDIQKMINQGYFPGAYINESINEIVLPKNNLMNNIHIQNQLTQNTVSQHMNYSHQPKVIVCKNCGANNTIGKENITECEFCGSPLS